ncbi:hypothetical protein L0Y46_00205, partial [bacterium]|nr:hypothetical protein [bacterium]
RLKISTIFFAFLAAFSPRTMNSRYVNSFFTSSTVEIFINREIDFWLERNATGRAVFESPDKFGLEFIDPDHYTFRSSRKNFKRAIEVFDLLGFRNRERFYAGAEAGWGAQVMEHPETGHVLFVDVDLAPEETDVDFTREDLPPLSQKGTIETWCDLHGDFLFESGFHHVAIRCDIEKSTELLRAKGIRVMDRFTDLPYLKQAFTEGEIWTAKDGTRAIGSHLELIERRDGFKGFNSKGVSDIIRRTDPRIQVKEEK